MGQSDQKDGYESEAYSETNPYIALGELKAKIRYRLSVRHISKYKGRMYAIHDYIEGRVGYEGVIFDGEFIDFEEFSDIIQQYEGFRFSLSVRESTELIP